MDVVTLARLQFAATTVYHFFFVPLTLGLSVLVALMETLYVRTGNDLYLRMTKFWGKLFLINFAMGVVTGIVQEFQFGMNWSEYSRFVGDVFGAPLAIEALLAFFLESTFLGLWLFGWDKVSKGMHLVAIWLVAIGSNISALWILIANSFMQEPVGYVINNGRAEMTSFSDLVLNPNVWVMFPHTVSGGFVTAAFFLMGISAYHLIRKRQPDVFRRSFQIGAIVGVAAVLMVGLNGHTQTQHLIKIQPMKFAAAEALFETESPASFSLLSIVDSTQKKEIFALRLPVVLCLLANNSLDCTVEGINQLQAKYVAEYGSGDYIPPVAVIYWSFRLMVGAGMLMMALALFALYLTRGRNMDKHQKLLGLFLWAMLLPYLANSFGWIMTELGRFPWVVYGLMTIQDAVSNTVPAGHVLISLIGYTVVYGALMVVTIGLMTHFARQGAPELPGDTTPGDRDEPLPSLVDGQY